MSFRSHTRRLRAVAAVALAVLAAVPAVSASAASVDAQAPTLTRNEVLTRAQRWVDRKVPYNQGAYFEGYRTDCSGYVSMAWKLSNSETTPTLPYFSFRIAKADLQPGDILLNTSPGNAGHVTIFHKWANTAKTEYWAYDESGRKTMGRAAYRKITYPYTPGHGTFNPYRSNKLR